MLLLIEYIIVLPVLMTVLIILSSLADAKRSSLQTPGRTVSCFFPSFFSGSIQVVYFRVHFFERIRKRNFDLESYGFFTTEKAEDPKKKMIICYDNVREQRREKVT